MIPNEPVFIPFHKSSFPKAPFTVIFQGHAIDPDSLRKQEIGSMTSSSFLKRTDNIHPCGHRGQTHSRQTNLAGLIGAVWRWRGSILCHCNYVHSCTNTCLHTHMCKCTDCAGSGQNVMLYDNTLLCWIWIHWDFLAHTRMLHSVIYRVSARLCLFLMWFKCI